MNEPTATWHAPADVLDRFVGDPAALDATTASSLESHLVACARCRADLARRADPHRLAASWAAVADRVDRPRARLFEQVLGRLGVRSGPARLAAATPGLRASGISAVAALTAVAVVVTRQSASAGPFLAVAPLVPLVAVALTFAPVNDPGGEAGLATPVAGAGLALRRAVAVLAVALVTLGVGSLAVPGLDGVPLRWLLPALALALASLALGTWVRLELALGALALAWAATLGLSRWLLDVDEPLAVAPPFTVGGQVVALLVATAAGAALLDRAGRYSELEAR